MHRRRLGNVIAIARMTIALALLAGPAFAGGSALVVDDSAADFSKGETAGTVVAPTGELSAGITLSRTEVPATSIWSVLDAPDAGLYLGTGAEGTIVRVVSGKPEVAYRTGQVAVTAIAATKGAVYFGTIPAGQIFRLSAEGDFGLFADLEASYIWQITPSGDDLLVATGDPGSLVILDAAGKTRKTVSLPDRNALSLLAPAGDTGNWLVGTAPKGYLCEVDVEAGKVQVLHTFGAGEVKALARRPDGTLLLGVNRPVKPNGDRPPESYSHVLAKDPASGGGQQVLAGAIHTRSTDGRVETLWKTDTDFLLCLTVGTDGDAWLGTGNHGLVLRVDAGGRTTTVFDLDEAQVLVVRLADGAPAFLATAGGAAIHRAGGEPGESPGFTSRVLDAGHPARWGALHVDGTGEWTVATRTGNTEKPDDTWSAWSDPEAGSPAAISSPTGRYLQYRLSWKNADAVVRQVRAAYLAPNLRARITAITIEDVKDEEQAAPEGGSASSKAAGHSTRKAIGWAVENPDEDPLEYRVWFRGEGDQNWRRIDPERTIRKKKLPWETDAIPDGRYVIKVEADDAPGNPPARALQSSLESEPFLVDNGKPAVLDLLHDATAGRITGRASDAVSLIDHLAYAVDGKAWTVLFPEDLIFDAREEAFAVDLSGLDLEPGTHALTVKTVDEAGNVGAARISFEIQ